MKRLWLESFLTADVGIVSQEFSYFSTRFKNEGCKFPTEIFLLDIPFTYFLFQRPYDRHVTSRESWLQNSSEDVCRTNSIVDEIHPLTTASEYIVFQAKTINFLHSDVDIFAGRNDIPLVESNFKNWGIFPSLSFVLKLEKSRF